VLPRLARRTVVRACALLALSAAPLAAAAGPAAAAPLPGTALLATLDPVPASVDVIALVGTNRRLYTGLVGQGSLVDLGGELHGTPLLVAGEQASYVVGLGKGDVPYVRSFQRAWRRLAPAGITCQGPSAAVSGATLTVSCRGSNGHLWSGSTQLAGDALPYVATWTDRGGSVPYGTVAGVDAAGVVSYEVVGTDHASYRKTGSKSFTRVAGAPLCFGPLSQDDISGGGRACAAQDGALQVSSNDPADADGIATVRGRVVGRPGVARDVDGSSRYYVVGTDARLYVADQPAGGTLRAFRSVPSRASLFGLSAASLGASSDTAQALGQLAG